MNSRQEQELEALRNEIRAVFPPERILSELGGGGKVRGAVLGAALVLVKDIADALLAAVEPAAAGAELNESESSLAFYAIHILGGARDTRLFPLLLRVLSLPDEQLDGFLGDSLTETIKRVAIGSFNGDSDAVFAFIADTRSDEYARLALLEAATFLTFEGRIDAATFKRFLVRFDDERLAPDEDMAWWGWTEAIALLGLADLAPRVEAAWRDGRLEEEYSDLAYFFGDLKRAERDRDDPARFKDAGLGYMEDLGDELDWIVNRPGDDGESEAGDFTRDSMDFESSSDDRPYLNPLRHVGRNDPCPCGSGKKAKRCCLAS